MERHTVHKSPKRDPSWSHKYRSTSTSCFLKVHTSPLKSPKCFLPLFLTIFFT